MTLLEIIYQLRLDIRKQELFDDDELSNRMIKKWVHDQRALWIRNELNKNHSIDDQIIQPACMELEVADRSDCPGKTTGVSVLKSKLELPKTIELHHTDGIINVAPVDKLAYSFSYVPLQRAKFAGNGQFNANIITVFRYNNYIYLTSKRVKNFARYVRFIMVYGLFEDPTALEAFTHVSGDTCYSDDDDYPVNSWMWNYMRTEILKLNLPLVVEGITDKVNDADEKVEKNA